MGDLKPCEYRCPTCGRLDPFNQTVEDALRAEIAALKERSGVYDGSVYIYCGHEYHSLIARMGAEMRDMSERLAKLTKERDRYRDQFRAAKRSVCDLEARYMGDLTKQQRADLYDMDVFCNSLERKDVLSIDAAIRKVREGAGK